MPNICEHVIIAMASLHGADTDINKKNLAASLWSNGPKLEPQIEAALLHLQTALQLDGIAMLLVEIMKNK